MLPKAPALTLLDGLPKFARFKVLKNSALA